MIISLLFIDIFCHKSPPFLHLPGNNKQSLPMIFNRQKYMSPQLIDEAFVVEHGFNEMSPSAGDDWTIDGYDQNDIYSGDNSGSWLD